MPSTEIDPSVKECRRYKLWLGLAVFSAICLAATLSGHNTWVTTKSGGEKFVLSVEIISIVFAASACVAYLLFRRFFEGQLTEAALVLLMILLWVVTLPFIMNPKTGLAVSKLAVINANLYFFSWAALTDCLLLLADLVVETSREEFLRKTSPKKAQYVSLCASSLVTMSAAVTIFKIEECPDPLYLFTEICKRTKFAIALGCIGFVSSCIMIVISSFGKGIGTTVETAGNAFQMILWVFGVGFITFGDSPGQTIGNLYFATWISFVLTVFLFGQSFGEFLSKRSSRGKTEHNGEGSEQESPSSANSAMSSTPTPPEQQK